MLYHKLEKEDYDCLYMWTECQKEVFVNIQEGKGSIGKRREKWLGHVENDLKKVCLRS